MQPIRTKEEFDCDRCGNEADISIEFQSHTYTLCNSCEEEFKEYIKEEYL